MSVARGMISNSENEPNMNTRRIGAEAENITGLKILIIRDYFMQSACSALHLYRAET